VSCHCMKMKEGLPFEAEQFAMGRTTGGIDVAEYDLSNAHS
jgi:hypothetical protein